MGKLTDRMRERYYKDGPGVAKSEAASSYGPYELITLYVRHFWQLTMLNIIYLVSILPVVTYGPATAAMTYVLRNYSRKDHVDLWQDYWGAFKRNFWQGLGVGLIDLAILLILGYSLWFYSLNVLPADMFEPVGSASAEASGEASPSPTAEATPAPTEEPAASGEPGESGEEVEPPFLYKMGFGVSLVAGVLYLFMRYYIYLMVVTFKLNLIKLLKNAFIFSILAVGKNIIISAVVILILIVWYMLSGVLPPLLILLPLVLLFSTCGFVITYIAYGPLKKYMVDPALARQNASVEVTPTGRLDEQIFVDTIVKEDRKTKKSEKK